MAKEEKILIVLTGGTIDGYVSPGVKPKQNHSPVKTFLQKLKLHQKLQFQTACKKDSREITAIDRDKIISIIRETPIKSIIVTHGTYTMVETGRYLKDRLRGNRKIIILTGALAPLDEPFSDAEFNLGFSIRETHKIDHGVYLCMNGKTFTPENAYKNIRKKMFEEA